LRINKFIANSGYCSRRKADEFIEKGAVKMNGKIVNELGSTLDPKKDKITVHGNAVSLPNEKTLILFHKPAGVLTTRHDPRGEQTIYDLLPKQFHHLHSIGRLDKNTEGLLLLTDDGDLTYQLTHPKNGGEKKYEVTVRQRPTPEELKRLEKGVRIKEEVDEKISFYITQPCKIEALKKPNSFLVTLQEGRKRQIRKMFDSIRCPVVYLKRISMGPYTLGTLPIGEFRILEF